MEELRRGGNSLFVVMKVQKGSSIEASLEPQTYTCGV